MNSYILLKDLPTLKKGAIFTYYLNNGICKLYSNGHYEFTDKFLNSADGKKWFKKKRNKVK